MNEEGEKIMSTRSEQIGLAKDVFFFDYAVGRKIQTTHWKHKGDDLNTCPACGEGATRHDLWKHHFIVCDACRIYWYAGANLMTPHYHLLDSTAEIARAHEDTYAILISYERVDILPLIRTTTKEKS